MPIRKLSRAPSIQETCEMRESQGRIFEEESSIVKTFFFLLMSFTTVFFLSRPEDAIIPPPPFLGWTGVEVFIFSYMFACASMT